MLALAALPPDARSAGLVFGFLPIDLVKAAVFAKAYNILSHSASPRRGSPEFVRSLVSGIVRDLAAPPPRA